MKRQILVVGGWPEYVQKTLKTKLAECGVDIANHIDSDGANLDLTRYDAVLCVVSNFSHTKYNNLNKACNKQSVQLISIYRSWSKTISQPIAYKFLKAVS